MDGELGELPGQQLGLVLVSQATTRSPAPSVVLRALPCSVHALHAASRPCEGLLETPKPRFCNSRTVCSGGFSCLGKEQKGQGTRDVGAGTPLPSVWGSRCCLKITWIIFRFLRRAEKMLFLLKLCPCSPDRYTVLLQHSPAGVALLP